jgi:hypothetical protein
VVGGDRHFQLGADAVGRRDENRVREAGRARVEEAAEPAERGVRAGPRGRSRQRLDGVDQTIAGIDIDPRVAVGKSGFGGVAGYGVLAPETV